MKQMFASAALVAALTSVAAAQAPPTAPGPEAKALAHFAGTWKMEGTMQASPLGPGGKFTGTETCKMFEGGFHLVCDSKGSGPMGNMTGHAVMTYDRSTKQYRYFAVSNMADAEMATGGLSDKTWTWTSKMDVGGGKVMHSRFVIVEKSPTSHTVKWEMSEDGQNWKSLMEGTSTKVGS